MLRRIKKVAPYCRQIAPRDLPGLPVFYDFYTPNPPGNLTTSPDIILRSAECYPGGL